MFTIGARVRPPVQKADSQADSAPPSLCPHYQGQEGKNLAQASERLTKAGLHDTVSVLTVSYTYDGIRANNCEHKSTNIASTSCGHQKASNRHQSYGEILHNLLNCAEC